MFPSLIFRKKQFLFQISIQVQSNILMISYIIISHKLTQSLIKF